MARYNPEKHHRKSTRYDGYDYTAAGGYFVTICVRWGRCLLSTVKEQNVCLSPAGIIVEDGWFRLKEKFPTIVLDELVIMPNHVHFIVWLNPIMGKSVRASFNDALTHDALTHDAPAPLQRPQWDKNAPALGEVVRSFKAAATAEIRFWYPEMRFEWLRNYWDRILRDNEELEIRRSYIRANPARWRDDQLHPDAPPNQFNQAWHL